MPNTNNPIDLIQNPFLAENSIYQNKIAIKKSIVNPFKNTVLPNTRQVLLQSISKGIQNGGTPYSDEETNRMASESVAELSDKDLLDSADYEDAINNMPEEKKKFYDDSTLDSFGVVKKYGNALMTDNKWNALTPEQQQAKLQKALTVKQIMLDDEFASQMYNQENGEFDDNGVMIKAPKTPYKSAYKMLKIVDTNDNITPIVIDTEQLDFEKQEFTKKIADLKKQKEKIISNIDLSLTQLNKEGMIYIPTDDPAYNKALAIDNEIKSYEEAIKHRDFILNKNSNDLIKQSTGSLTSAIGNVMYEAPKMAMSLLAGSKFSPLSIVGLAGQLGEVASVQSGHGDRMFGLYDAITPKFALENKETNDALNNLAFSSNGLIDANKINPATNEELENAEEYSNPYVYGGVSENDMFIEEISSGLAGSATYIIDFGNVLKSGSGYFTRAQKASKYKSFKESILEPVKDDFFKNISNTGDKFKSFGKVFNKEAGAIGTSLKEAQAAKAMANTTEDISKAELRIAELNKQLELAQATKGQERIYNLLSKAANSAYTGTIGYVATQALSNLKTDDVNKQQNLALEIPAGLTEEFAGLAFDLAFSKLRLKNAYGPMRLLFNRGKEAFGETFQEVAGDLVRNKFEGRETDSFLAYMAAIMPMTLTMGGIKQSEKKFTAERMKDPNFVKYVNGVKQYQLPMLNKEKQGYVWSTVNPITGKAITHADVKQFVKDEYNEIDHQFSILSANELKAIQAEIDNKAKKPKSDKPPKPDGAKPDEPNGNGSNTLIAETLEAKVNSIPTENKNPNIGYNNPESNFDLKTKFDVITNSPTLQTSSIEINGKRYGVNKVENQKDADGKQSDVYNIELSDGDNKYNVTYNTATLEYSTDNAELKAAIKKEFDTNMLKHHFEVSIENNKFEDDDPKVIESKYEKSIAEINARRESAISKMTSPSNTQLKNLNRKYDSEIIQQNKLKEAEIADIDKRKQRNALRAKALVGKLETKVNVNGNDYNVELDNGIPVKVTDKNFQSVDQQTENDVLDYFNDISAKAQQSIRTEKEKNDPIQSVKKEIAPKVSTKRGKPKKPVETKVEPTAVADIEKRIQEVENFVNQDFFANSELLSNHWKTKKDLFENKIKQLKSLLQKGIKTGEDLRTLTNLLNDVRGILNEGININAKTAILTNEKNIQELANSLFSLISDDVIKDYIQVMNKAMESRIGSNAVEKMLVGYSDGSGYTIDGKNVEYFLSKETLENAKNNKQINAKVDSIPVIEQTVKETVTNDVKAKLETTKNPGATKTKSESAEMGLQFTASTRKLTPEELERLQPPMEHEAFNDIQEEFDMSEGMIQVVNDRVAKAEEKLPADDRRSQINKAESEIQILAIDNAVELEFQPQYYVNLFRELITDIDLGKKQLTIEEAKQLCINKMECN